MNKTSTHAPSQTHEPPLMRLSPTQRQHLVLALAELIAEQQAEQHWLTTLRSPLDQEVDDDDLV